MINEVFTVDGILILILLNFIQIIKLIILNFLLQNIKISNKVFNNFFLIIDLFIKTYISLDKQLDNVANESYSPNAVVDSCPRYG